MLLGWLQTSAKEDININEAMVLLLKTVSYIMTNDVVPNQITLMTFFFVRNLYIYIRQHTFQSLEIIFCIKQR